MNPKNRFLVLFCFVLFFLSGVSRSFAQRAETPSTSKPVQKPGNQQAQPQIFFLWDYSKQLGLTKTQMSAMQNAFEDFQKSMIQLKAKLSLSEIDLQELLNKNADLKLIHAQVEKSAAIEGDMRFAEIKFNHTILSLLTPAQLKTWHQIVLQNEEQAQTQNSAPQNAQSNVSHGGK
jgi:hypothetical protein